MEDKIELNLDNPIFAHYVNIEGMSRQRAEEILMEYQACINIYSNVTIWIVASNISKIECVYDGRSRNRDVEISRIVKEINKRIDILSNSNSFEDFKINVRDWRLNEIIENELHQK